ncbi:MAG: SurA N-terminal domain-containing protein [Candidatus Omnitrophica bacterium]|nr:SurA N-terminal domain-containing protein [Candidatus Omnitrophota bacterium]
MLKQLRRKNFAKKVWIFLAIFIIPAFVLWGSGSLMRDRKDSGFKGKLFGRKISAQEYGDALAAVENQALMQFGDKLEDIKKYLNLEYQAWERLLLLHEARKRRIRVTDKEIVGWIQSSGMFQRKGNFDQKTYDEILRYVFRTQPRTFEEQTRENLTLAKLYSQITKDVTITDQEIKQAYLKENQEARIRYIATRPEEFVSQVVLPDEEVEEYYTRNSLEFKQPLSFNLEYLAFDNEEQAKSAAARLFKREEFKKVADELGVEPKETGLFSQIEPIPGIGWSPQVIGIVSKLKPGAITPSLQIDKEFYVLKLKERKEPFIPEFAQIKEKVKDSVVQNKSTEIAQKKIEECLQKLSTQYLDNPEALDFSKAAEECGLAVKTTEPFKFGSYIEGIGASDTFWQVALTLQENQFSQILGTPTGFYIIQPTSNTSPNEEEFEARKEEFSVKALEQKKQELFSKFTEQLKRKEQLF